MDEYLITRLISDKSILFPGAKGFGDVEIHSNRLDFPSETELLKQSCTAFEEHINLNLAQRITIIISAENPYEADKQAEVKFEQVIDCLSIFSPIHSLLLSSGFIKNYKTGWKSPRLPKKTVDLSPIFVTYMRDIEQVNEPQALLAFPETDLKITTLRSIHWLRKAGIESIIQLKFLFGWFALETLAKVQEGENITSKLLQVLGFPLGEIGLLLSHEIILKIKDHPHYELVKRYFRDNFERMRDYRNRIVHSGFRQWDIPGETLLEFDQIVFWTISRLQSYAIDGLYQGLKSVEELWEYFPLIFFERSDYLRDFHGNILSYFGSRKKDVNHVRFIL